MDVGMLIQKRILENSHIYRAENSKMDVGKFTSEFSVTGVLWSAASVISGGNF
jgi:hypothetical protein